MAILSVIAKLIVNFSGYTIQLKQENQLLIASLD